MEMKCSSEFWEPLEQTIKAEDGFVRIVYL